MAEINKDKPKFEKFLPLILAFIAIVGGGVGALVTHYLSQSRTLDMETIVMQRKAFSSFIKGQTMLWKEPEKEREANSIITESKLNILLISPRKVICAMVTYWAFTGKFSSCPDEEEKLRDVAIYQAMRNESFSDLNLPDPNLEPEILVPFIRLCLLSGVSPEELCNKRKNPPN